MYYFILTVILLYFAYQYYSNYQLTERFTCYPDIYDNKYDHSIKTNELHKEETEKLISREPKYINKSIIPLSKDIKNTIYYSAHSKEGELLGYIKMTVTENFMANLIDTGFYEQELFGFSGWTGYHVYEVVAIDDKVLYKLFKRAIHQLKQDGSRYYLSILCLTEELGKNLMNKFKFTLALKEQSKRFYKNTLYTLVYYK
jgi:hypothetical protein